MVCERWSSLISVVLSLTFVFFPRRKSRGYLFQIRRHSKSLSFIYVFINGQVAARWLTEATHVLHYRGLWYNSLVMSRVRGRVQELPVKLITAVR